MKIHRPIPSEADLARCARDLAAAINPLFHGTRYLNEILASGFLEPSTVGATAVCFSRSPDAAAYWAAMPRDDDEGRGAVLVFDRDRLATRYRLDLVNEGIYIDEQEERVWCREIPLGIALIGIASQPIPTRSRRERSRVRKGLHVRSASALTESRCVSKT
jgi:hypothetical protein